MTNYFVSYVWTANNHPKIDGSMYVMARDVDNARGEAMEKLHKALKTKPNAHVINDIDGVEILRIVAA